VNAAPLEAQRILGTLFHAALRAADPARAVAAVVTRIEGRTAIDGVRLAPGTSVVVVAAGKAAPTMAAAAEHALGEHVAGGVAVTRDGHGRPLERLTVVESAHPVPDARSVAAGRGVLACAAATRPEDVLLVLLSGGASALLSCPLPGLGAGEVVATTDLLLSSGAPIEDLNCVRKHISDVGGGRLARASRAARLHLLVVSDVIGDRLDVIGSGPCTPDPTTYADALGVLERHGLLERVPRSVRAHLEAGRAGRVPESAKPGEPCFERVRPRVVASNREAREAVQRTAIALGLDTRALSQPIRGEARRAGARLAALGRSLRVERPTLLVAGGETTVTVRGPGRGGRNQELALAAALALDGVEGVSLLAAGTDGSDGPTDATGAFVDGGTVRRGAACRVSAASALDANDSHGFFCAEGGCLRTGPTGTNVMDLVLLLCLPAATRKEMVPRPPRAV